VSALRSAGEKEDKGSENWRGKEEEGKNWTKKRSRWGVYCKKNLLMQPRKVTGFTIREGKEKLSAGGKGVGRTEFREGKGNVLLTPLRKGRINGQRDGKRAKDKVDSGW